MVSINLITRHLFSPLSRHVTAPSVVSCVRFSLTRRRSRMFASPRRRSRLFSVCVARRDADRSLFVLRNRLRTEMCMNSCTFGDPISLELTLSKWTLEATFFSRSSQSAMHKSLVQPPLACKAHQRRSLATFEHQIGENDCILFERLDDHKFCAPNGRIGPSEGDSNLLSWSDFSSAFRETS